MRFSDKRLKTAFLLLLILSGAFGTGSVVWAQQQEITLPSRSLTVGDVLNEIRRQTRYRFAVNRSRFELDRTVTLSRSEGNIEEILLEVLRGSDHVHQISGRQILIIYREPEPVAVAEPVRIPEPEVPEKRPEIFRSVTPPAANLAQAPVEMQPIRSRVVRHMEKKFSPMIALKTNLVYWAGIMPDFHYYTVTPNIGVEFFAGRRWSVSADWAYAKWNASGDDFWGISSWSLEPRMWFSADGEYRGVFLGLYGNFGDFDAKNDRTGEFGRTGTFYGGGLSAGIAVSFSKNWGLEAALRGGFRHSSYKAYSQRIPEYIYEYSESDSSWGLTGINVSLSYRFGKRER